MWEVVGVGIDFGVNYLPDNLLHGKVIMEMTLGLLFSKTSCHNICLNHPLCTSIAFRNNPIGQSNVSARCFPCLPRSLTSRYIDFSYYCLNQIWKRKWSPSWSGSFPSEFTGSVLFPRSVYMSYLFSEMYYSIDPVDQWFDDPIRPVGWFDEAYDMIYHTYIGA